MVHSLIWRTAERHASRHGWLARLEVSLRTFAERAWQGRRLAYGLLAEPASPSVEAERLTYRVEYQAVFRSLLEEAILDGSLSPHDSNLLAAALTGAMAEALVGPLSTAGEGRRDRSTLIDDLVAICPRTLPTPDPPPRTEPQ